MTMQWAVATATFREIYDGKSTLVFVGERFGPFHEIVERWPQYFELEVTESSTPLISSWEPSSQPAAASTGALDTFRERVDAADIVRLGGTPRLPYRIAIPHVQRGSMSFAADMFGFSQERECGGILIGREDPDGVTVLDTTDDARGERNSARLEFEPPERRARELDCQVVGTWHTHNDAECTRPSPTDMRSLANMLLVYGLERCAGLVLTPHSTTGRPVFNTYIARRDGARTVVEPAVIEVD